MICNIVKNIKELSPEDIHLLELELELLKNIKRINMNLNNRINKKD